MSVVYINSRENDIGSQGQCRCSGPVQIPAPPLARMLWRVAFTSSWQQNSRELAVSLPSHERLNADLVPALCSRGDAVPSPIPLPPWLWKELLPMPQDQES